MKKNFLLAMVVMLMTAVSSFAQKEYNMVITLSNGTTVTLGHNDIKEITFNDGEVAISGNMVNTIDSLVQVTRELNYRFLDNKTHIDYLDNRIDKLANVTIDGFNQLGTEVDTKLNNMANAVGERFSAYEKALNGIMDFMENQNEVNASYEKSLDMIIYFIEKFHPEIAGSKEYKAAKAAVAAARKK